MADAAGDVPKPSTVILACSDSRVPPEIICDQGLGDCHVVRFAKLSSQSEATEQIL